MPQYQYVATDNSRTKTTGNISAANEKEARGLLRENDLYVLEIKEVKVKTEKEKKGVNFSIGKPRIKLNEVTLFCRQFATLIDSSVPITKSLYIMTNNTQNKDFAKILKKITSDVESGNTLSESFSRHPEIFPPLYIDMIAAGEMSGALGEVLNRLATYMEKDKAVRSKVKSAFIYPSAVISVVIIVVIIMMIVVIPKFEELFAGLGSELPLPTKILLGASDGFLKYWWLLLIIVVASVISLKIYSKTELGRKNLDRIKLKMPVLGQVVTKSSVARFCRTLETLQRSGVPLMQSLDIVSRTAGNKIVEEAIKNSISSLEQGNRISQPLEESKVFPPLVTQMIAIGEETGELETLLGKIAEFYEEEVDLAVKNLSSMLEPLITIVIGVIVAFIALAVITPMYSMMGELQNM